MFMIDLRRENIDHFSISEKINDPIFPHIPVDRVVHLVQAILVDPVRQLVQLHPVNKMFKTVG